MDISSLTSDKQVKLQYWLDVIRQCRASGMTNQAWCEQHNISLIRKFGLMRNPYENLRSDYKKESFFAAYIVYRELSENGSKNCLLQFLSLLCHIKLVY